MAAFFLCMIYAAFISLGLPDSLLGAAWPAMQPALGVPLDSAGVLSMIVAGGTVVASLSADRMLHRFGTGRVTLVSVTMTACALLGYALAPGFWWLALAAVPMGLGAGAVDAGLNNFVALHYEARHMSWLHCFWGVGATLGPVILSLFLGGKHGWRGGYGAVCAIQFCLVAVLAVTLPMWDRYEDRAALRAEAAAAKQAGKKQSTLNIPGVKGALATFFFYCAIEAAAGLWGASYLVEARGLSAEAAARGVSLYFLGITLGRFLSGFASMRMKSAAFIRLGQLVSAGGAVLLMLPLPAGFGVAAMAVLGLGFAPVYPSMIHETPYRFGAERSQAVIGLQMACAYVGTTFMPALFGVLAARLGIGLLPAFLLAGVAGMLLCAERVRTLWGRERGGGIYAAFGNCLIADSALRRLGRESGKGNPCLSESEEDGGGYRFVPRDVEQRIQYLRTARGGVEG